MISHNGLAGQVTANKLAAEGCWTAEVEFVIVIALNIPDPQVLN